MKPRPHRAVHPQVESVLARKGRHGAPAAVDLAHLQSQREQGEDTTFNAPTSVYESPSHYLHGVLHMNGYGHLVRG